MPEEAMFARQIEQNYDAFQDGLINRHAWEVINHYTCKGYITMLTGNPQLIKRAKHILESMRRRHLIDTLEYLNVVDEIHDIVERYKEKTA